MDARDKAAGILGPGKMRQMEEAGLVAVERDAIAATRRLANEAAFVANDLHAGNLHKPAQLYSRDRLWKALGKWRAAVGITGDDWPIKESGET